MGWVVGQSIYQGLFTEAEMLRGKVPSPGHKVQVTVGTETKEFVCVKIASGNHQSGTIVRVDASGLAFAAVCETNPPATINGRLGILVFSSATLTQTMGATAYGYAQIYGQCLARVSTTVSLAGAQLVLGADPGQLINAAGVSS